MAAPKLLGVATLMTALSSVLPEIASHGSLLSRHKRYVVFPEGSSWAVNYCVSVKVLSGDGDANIFTEGINWTASYDLPNMTFVEQFYNKKNIPAPGIFRRRRRDVYRKIEKLVDSADMDGHTCLLRALCESAQRFSVGGTLGEEVLRTIFSWPAGKVPRDEPAEHHRYELAHRRGRRQTVDCEQHYPCPISLIDLLFYGHFEGF